LKGISLDVKTEELKKNDIQETNPVAATADKQRRLETCAIKIQFAFRTYKAMQGAKRDNLPALDDHGHHNPSTIKFYNSAPVVHVHHHGKVPRYFQK
jgi:hypothetical protein